MEGDKQSGQVSRGKSVNTLRPAFLPGDWAAMFSKPTFTQIQYKHRQQPKDVFITLQKK